MSKKYLDYLGLETLVNIIKQKFEPVNTAIGSDEEGDLIAVTQRIKDEAEFANYKEKETNIYTFIQDGKTFVITSKDILTGKTTDDILANDNTTKLSDVFPEIVNLNDVLELVTADETSGLIMYSIKDELDILDNKNFDIPISKEEGNIIEMKEDGLYAFARSSSSSLYLKDEVTELIYRIGIANGNLFYEQVDSSVQTNEVTLTDEVTSQEYQLVVHDGVLAIRD